LIKSDSATTLLNLGNALAMAGRFPEAEADFRAALEIKPFNADAHRNLALLLRQGGHHREAGSHYQIALRFKPDVQTRLEFAGLLYQTGEAHRAVDELHRILAVKPDHVEALNNLAWLRATCGNDEERDAAEAILCAEKACTLTSYQQPRYTGTLAAAYAEAGRYQEAVATGRTTVKLAQASGDARLTYVGNQLLNLYQDNKPYHEPLIAKASPQ
jgi:tetratricopeptide (TPR) repeat protein